MDRVVETLLPRLTRTRDAAHQAAQTRREAAEARRRCGCEPRPGQHIVRTWHHGREAPIDTTVAPDEGHRAYQQLTHQMALFAYRSEFIFSPSVEVTTYTGGVVGIAVPSLQRVELT